MSKLYVAMITPFNELNEIDYEKLPIIIDKLIDEGVDGLMICGTTGESCTLLANEKLELLTFTISYVDSRCEIWYGCGSNATSEVLNAIQSSKELNFDGYLIVTPYYNLPSQYGLYEHFALLASHSTKPILLYNVPKRCGTSLKSETIHALARDYPNIVGLKQADHDLQLVKDILAKNENFVIYSGEDAYLLEGMQSGMSGVISVIGHLYAKEMKQFLLDFDSGKDCQNQDLFFKMVSKLLFLESNPTCVKYVYEKLGLCRNQFRLPLTPIQKESERQLDTFFK